ncbi:hypothetical protein HMN09_00909500 [Mycena chlorophos]|uniref:Uncharacterized protein n=1 Tax=Mycena chlorophos TaxID=658473 RepID=A0A8H6W4N8_MYCCL|nr:hypothetical protein HMN09_00909500 [Mycena chlorophos]
MPVSRLARTRALVAGSLVPVVLVQLHSFLDTQAPEDSSPPEDSRGYIDVYVPHPISLPILFVMQLALQGLWLYRMFCAPAGAQGRRRRRQVFVFYEVEDETQPLGEEDNEDEEEIYSPTSRAIDDAAEPTQLAYGPVYALCNLFFAGAVFAWTIHHWVVSHILTILNTSGQLYFIFRVLSPEGKYALTRRNRLTHAVAKTNAGLAILYLARAWGALGIGASRPIFQQQAFVAVTLSLLAFGAGPDPSLGLCLILDLVALAAGTPSEPWRIFFLVLIGVLVAIVTSDSFLAWRNRRTMSFNMPPEAMELALGLSPDREAYHDSEIYLADARTPSPKERSRLLYETL